MAGSYWYLGAEQMMGVRSGEVVSKVRAEYIWTVRKTWHTNLNMRKTIQIHNAY